MDNNNFERLKKVVRYYIYDNLSQIGRIVSEKLYYYIKTAIEIYRPEQIQEAYKYITSKGTEGLPYRYYALQRYLTNKDTSTVREREKYFKNYKNYRNYAWAGCRFINYILENQPASKFPDTKHVLPIFESIANRDLKHIGCIHLFGRTGSGKTALANMLTHSVQNSMIGENFDGLINTRVCSMDHTTIDTSVVKDYIKLFSGDEKLYLTTKNNDLHFTDSGSIMKPFVIATTHTSPLTNPNVKHEHAIDIYDRTIEFQIDKELDKDYIKSIMDEFGIETKIPLTPVHYNLYLSYLNSGEPTIDFFFYNNDCQTQTMWDIIKEKIPIDKNILDHLLDI